MSDLELSLDDIIKRKQGKTGPSRDRNNVLNTRKPVTGVKRLSDQRNSINANNNNNNTKPFVKLRRGVLTGNRGYVAPSVVGDARMKIIQKQRNKITDAREKLGEIAKQTDARVRLEKLRDRQRGGGGRNRIREQVPEQILQRTISGHVSNKAMDYENDLDYADEVAYMSHSFAERAAIDPDYSYQYARRMAAPDPPRLYRTVENDLPLYVQDEDLYSWTNPQLSPSLHEDSPNIPLQRMAGRLLAKPLSHSNVRRDKLRSSSPDWEYEDADIVITKKVAPVETVGILKRTQSHRPRPTEHLAPRPKPGPPRTLSERFCHDDASALKISQIKARLEASQANVRAAGAKAVVQGQTGQGHRIVVSNLVASVTHEDVKELFEDIGELLSSKVVRPGTAEVVYKNHRDAVKAVDVYHNRQLDGQPMKCLLVNNRATLPAPAKPSFSKSSDRGKTGKSVMELDMSAFRKALHKKYTS